jgi:hypothetical protein
MWGGGRSLVAAAALTLVICATAVAAVGSGPGLTAPPKTVSAVKNDRQMTSIRWNVVRTDGRLLELRTEGEIAGCFRLVGRALRRFTLSRSMSKRCSFMPCALPTQGLCTSEFGLNGP